jgi:restriction system protein
MDVRLTIGILAGFVCLALAVIAKKLRDQKARKLRQREEEVKKREEEEARKVRQREEEAKKREERTRKRRQRVAEAEKQLEERLKEGIKRQQEKKARKLAKRYGKPLGLKFRQLVVQDEYGHWKSDRWERELTYFMQNVLKMPKPKKTDTLFYQNKYNDTRSVLVGIAREAAKDLPVMGDISEVRNGLDYEHFVAKCFNNIGWKTVITKASGDQGADVKILLDGVDGVVQCKWHQNAVGNKAVQEIVAARNHYAVRHAIVVSKSGYTEAAKELAKTNGVFLIHHDEIPELHRRLSV